MLSGPVLRPDFRKPPRGQLALAIWGGLWTKVGAGGAVGVVCAPAALTAGGNADPPQPQKDGLRLNHQASPGDARV